MAEKRIGIIEHYYPKAHAAVVELEGDLHVGDTVHIAGKGVDFTETVERMEIDHEAIEEAHKGQHVGMQVDEPVKQNAEVFLVE